MLIATSAVRLETPHKRQFRDIYQRCGDQKYKHAEETLKQKPLTGLNSSP